MVLVTFLANFLDMSLKGFSMNLAVNFRLIFYMCGWVALLLAGTMLVPVGPALYFHDGTAVSFLKSAALAALAGGLLVWQGRDESRKELRNRDGLAVVGIAWLMIGLGGAIPYWMSGAVPGFWAGVFESFSGFSTTGGTAVADVEALPHGILFWRALTHWLGGMGIIVLMLAVLPVFGLSGVQLFKNEVPGQVAINRLKPRVAETAKLLWLIYCAITIILLILLLAGGLNWFEAICHTFSTMATGGFANKNDSIGFYGSAYVEIVITIFMFICSLNFAFYYRALHGNFKPMFKNAETRVFFCIIMVSGLLVSFSLLLNNQFESVGATLRHSFFQVMSVISTTGFATADWESWPHFSQGILFALFFVGGCSGSTCGGIKCIRWILLFKGVHRSLRQHIHPRAVLPIRLGGKAVPESVMTGVWAFGAIYFLALAMASLALVAMDMDILTAISASASALGNVGIGLGTVGPAENYAHMPGAAKGVLSLCMFLGRLEFFSLIILFFPDFWKK